MDDYLRDHRLVNKIDIPPDELYGAKDTIAGVYADGGVMQINPSPYGAAWAWCHVNAKNIALREDSGIILPTRGWPKISNNYAEFVACLRALEALPDGWSGHVYTDSNVTLGRFTLRWATTGIPTPLVRRACQCMERLGDTYWHLLDGHPTSQHLRDGVGKRGNLVSVHNKWCDEQCTKLMIEHMAKLNGGGGTA